MFKKSVPEPENFVLTRWLSDPYALGSYSYAAIGSTGKDRKILAEPISKRIFFTGEATHPGHYGTVHGALLAAQREAFRIHKLFCCKKIEWKNLPWKRSPEFS
ncbi:MAG: hypothetical protein D6813_10670 [Calditrichaeota bacterium]|nr:MAG: hypothetical protein D6813_10670 [Calditrichota bacterium]